MSSRRFIARYTVLLPVEEGKRLTKDSGRSIDWLDLTVSASVVGHGLLWQYAERIAIDVTVFLDEDLHDFNSKL